MCLCGFGKGYKVASDVKIFSHLLHDIPSAPQVCSLKRKQHHMLLPFDLMFVQCQLIAKLIFKKNKKYYIK